MSKLKYILWTVKANYTFPESETPEIVEDWWAESGPDFCEWVECESELLVCDSISLQDIDLRTGSCVVEYVIHLSFPEDTEDTDATEDMNDSLEVCPPEGWELQDLETVSTEIYTR